MNIAHRRSAKDIKILSLRFCAFLMLFVFVLTASLEFASASDRTVNMSDKPVAVVLAPQTESAMPQIQIERPVTASIEGAECPRPEALAGVKSDVAPGRPVKESATARLTSAESNSSDEKLVDASANKNESGGGLLQDKLQLSIETKSPGAENASSSCKIE